MKIEGVVTAMISECPLKVSGCTEYGTVISTACKGDTFISNLNSVCTNLHITNGTTSYWKCSLVFDMQTYKKHN